ncbi:MAG TPA: alpha/beta fold hydrolase [Solirubrobacteraceae bacterium]
MTQGRSSSAGSPRARGPGGNGGHRERSVTVAGIRLVVRELGEGHPVLLINGIGAHMDMWAPLERSLPAMRLIAFDAPGTGRSATSLVPLSLDLLTELTARMLDRLGYDRVDVLGYSFGGLVAQSLARRDPERVRRLVLAASTPGWGGIPGSMWTLGQMSTPLRYYWRPYYESVIGDLMGGRARRDREFVRRHGDARQLSPPTPLGYLWQVLALIGNPGSLGWLHELRCETLVVAGDDDPVMPLANALLLARHIPQARLLVAPGEGHLLLMDGSSAALPAINSFLSAAQARDSRAWQEATAVDQPMLDAGLGASRDSLINPWGLISAAVRELRRWQAPPARAEGAHGAPAGSGSSSIGTPSASRTRGTIE